MKPKKIQGGDHYSELEDLIDIDVWRAFEYQGHKLRCVPTEVNGGEATSCRSCIFARLRATNSICPGMQVCCGHRRKDRISVKYINADINCIQDERMREMAKQSDLKNRW